MPLIPPFVRWLMFSIVCISFTTFPALGASGTFNVPTTTGTYSWDNSANWAGGTIADGNGSTATFGPIAGTTEDFIITVDTARTIGNLAFSGDGTNTHNFTLSGPQTLTMASGLTPAISNSAPSRTISIAATLAGSQGLTLSNTSGTLSLAGNNTYTGTTTLTSGVVTISHNNALGATGSGNNTTVGASATLILANGVKVTGETLSIDSANNPNGTIQASGIAEWAGNILINNGTNARIGTANSSSQLTVSGVISNTVAGPLIISGLGTVVLSGANTYTGGTTLYRGTLKLSGGNNRMPTGTLLTIGGTANNATFDLNGVNQQLNGISNNATSTSIRTVTNSSTTASTLNLNLTASQTFLGDLDDVTQITGNLSITKNGSFTQTLAKTNSYTGNTTVNAGTLVLSDDATMKFYIGANGVNNRINGAGTMTLNGDFVFDLTSAVAVDGNSWNIVNVGTLSETFGSTFTVQGFTNNAGVWSSGGYQFSQATGLLTYTSVIPEPSTFGMLALGLGGCILLRRFRRHR